MKQFISSALILTFLVGYSPALVVAQVRSSSVYSIQSDSLNFAGVLSTSTSYGAEDTLGELGTGRLGSANYGLQDAGYQGMQLDIVSPSAPASISAVGITSSQIEVTWGDATDDYAVMGFYIYRDGVRIADVASFPRDYVDSGLTPSTSYDYTVTAYDGAGNESLHTATVTATTLTAVVPAASGGATPSGRNGTTITVNDFVITPSDTSALVSFTANIPVSGTLTINGQTLRQTTRTNHHYIIRNLLPHTTYYFHLDLVDANGNTLVFDKVPFTTLLTALARQPLNVMGFSATARTPSIDLAWALPSDSSVVGVRIVRSTLFYPTHPYDGEVMYENTDSSDVTQFEDTKVKVGQTYYYTIFTEDIAGNFSSGVVSAARISRLGEPVVISTPLENLPQALHVDPKIEALLLKNFLFIQNGNNIPVKGGVVVINGEKNLTLALKSYLLPRVLKTIAVTLVTNEEKPKSFTVILRPNKNNTRYEATIAALGESGTYRIKVSVIDFKNQGLKKLKGTLLVENPLGYVGASKETKTLLASLLGLILVALFIVWKKTSLRKFFKKGILQNS